MYTFFFFYVFFFFLLFIAIGSTFSLMKRLHTIRLMFSSTKNNDNHKLIIVAVAVGCGCGCHGWWFVVTGGDGVLIMVVVLFCFVLFCFFFHVMLWLPK